jgi:homoserine kinase type II
MSVYTAVTTEELDAWLGRYALGTLVEFAPIAAGIENTNYFASTPRGEFVLTLFERLTFEQLPYYLELMRHLARKGIPVPAPQTDAHDALLHLLKDKPAAVVTRLSGRSEMSPSPQQCAQLGALLARMHLAVADFPLRQPNLRGLAWWKEIMPTLVPHLSETQAQLLRSEVAFQEVLAGTAQAATLPRGAVHADLFRDNAMFDQGRLGGVFDFYFAGDDTFIFDLCVCLNDWCIDPAAVQPLPEHARRLLEGYAAERALTPAERQLLPAMLRAAALRFWCSRLWDWHLPRKADVLKPHDPGHFEKILTLRRRDSSPRDAHA